MNLPWKNIQNQNLWDEENNDAYALEEGASLHFKIEGTKHEPFVHFDPELGILELMGRSVPEDSNGFYRPLLLRMNRYLKEGGKGLVCNIHLDYFNTSSARNLLEVLHVLEKIYAEGRSVMVNWVFDEEDEDLFNTGIDFSSLLHIPFSLFAMKEDGTMVAVPESDWNKEF